MGVRLARSIVTPSVLDLMELSGDYQLAEILLPSGWEGESLRSTDVRHKFGVNILSVHREGHYLVAPAPDMPFQSGDTLLVMGRREDVEKLRK